MIATNDVISTREIVTWETTAQQNLTTYYSKLGEMKLKARIVRHAGDDTFDIYINKGHSGDLIQRGLLVLNINNTFEFQVPNLYGSIKEKNGEIKIPHGVMKGMKFHDVQEIHIAYLRANIIIRKISLRPTFQVMNKELNVPIGKVGMVEMVKEFNVSMAGMKRPSVDGLNHFANIETVHNTKYSRVFYKPSKRDRYSPTHNLGDIYASKDSFLVGAVQNRFLAGKVKTTSHISGYEEIIDTQVLRNELIIEGVIDHPKLYGHLQNNESTFYDYKKKKTIIGYTPNSTKGEVIPFEYKGIYTWIQELGITSFLKSFKFTTTTSYNNAILNPFDGEIALEHKETNIPIETHYYSLNNKQIDLIKKTDDLSKMGLIRISNEKNN